MLEKEKNPSIYIPLVSNALNAAHVIFSTIGYTGVMVRESLSLLMEVEFHLLQWELPEDTRIQICNFLDEHLPSMCSEHRDYSMDNSAIRKMISGYADLDTGGCDNPLVSDRWAYLLGEDLDDSLTEYGYVKVVVKTLPNSPSGRRSFLFVTDQDSEFDYFVHRRNTDLTLQKFNEIRQGDVLSIRPGTPEGSGRAIPVIDAVLLSDS